MKTFGKYSIIVIIVLAAVLVFAWFYTSGEHFIRVLLICYGFLLGYLAAWFHIGCRQGFRKFSRFLADDFGV
jgi:xanthine/uracil permease